MVPSLPLGLLEMMAMEILVVMSASFKISITFDKDRDDIDGEHASSTWAICQSSADGSARNWG